MVQHHRNNGERPLTVSEVDNTSVSGFLETADHLFAALRALDLPNIDPNHLKMLAHIQTEMSKLTELLNLERAGVDGALKISLETNLDQYLTLSHPKDQKHLIEILNNFARDDKNGMIVKFYCDNANRPDNENVIISSANRPEDVIKELNLSGVTYLITSTVNNKVGHLNVYRSSNIMGIERWTRL